MFLLYDINLADIFVISNNPVENCSSYRDFAIYELKPSHNPQ